MLGAFGLMGFAVLVREELPSVWGSTYSSCGNSQLIIGLAAAVVAAKKHRSDGDARPLAFNDLLQRPSQFGLAD